MVMVAISSSRSHRLLSVDYYLGLGPLVRFIRHPSSNPFLHHHRAQAMAAFFFLLMLFLAACLFDTAECILVVQFPGFARQLMDRCGPILASLDSVVWAALAVAVILW